MKIRIVCPKTASRSREWRDTWIYALDGT
jgi:hypothetical protein